eukprot:1180787-Prorocentrum_minimum.AAC.3
MVSAPMFESASSTKVPSRVHKCTVIDLSVDLVESSSKCETLVSAKRKSELRISRVSQVAVRWCIKGCDALR